MSTTNPSNPGSKGARTGARAVERAGPRYVAVSMSPLDGQRYLPDSEPTSFALDQGGSVSSTSVVSEGDQNYRDDDQEREHEFDHGHDQEHGNQITKFIPLSSGGMFTVSLPSSSSVLHSATYSYAYGPKGLLGLTRTKYTLLCAFFASLGGLEFGYDQGVIANVLVMEDFLRRWPITPLEKGVMTAVLELGALLGALMAGVYADRYSRGKAIVFACIIFCIGSSFQSFARTLTDIFIGRAIGGIGVGALSMLSPLYISEISPPELRGSLMALEQLSIVTGVVFGFWTGFMTRTMPGSLSWRIPLGIQLIPAIVLALGCAVLPESPRLLVLKGRWEEARGVLRRLRVGGAGGGLTAEGEADGGGTDILVELELLEMRVETKLIQRMMEKELHLNLGELQTVEEGSEGKAGIKTELRMWAKLFSPRYRQRTWIGVLIMVFQQWSGINALLYYGPTLVRAIGLSGDDVTLLVSGGIGVMQLLAVIPAIMYIDSFGRKKLLRGGSVVMAGAHAVIALLVMSFQNDWPAHPWGAWGAVGGIYTFTLAYGVSFGPIGWVLPSEVFPLSMRSKGVALSTASNWINNFFIGLLTPVFVDVSPFLTFLIFAAACVSAYLWSTHFVPETANVPLEEVDKLFSSGDGKAGVEGGSVGVGREEREVRKQIEEELGLWELVKELADDAGLDIDG